MFAEFLNSTLESNGISLSIAFLGGIASFFAPCVIPLLPAYISYVAGVSLKDLEEEGHRPFRKRIFVSSILYILGFSLIFVVLGTSAAGLGIILRRYASEVQKIGGLIIIVLGLEFGGFLNMPFLTRERKFTLPTWTKKCGDLRAFLIGIIFATAWTPCVGAVLGSILALAAISGTAIHGAFLLFIYSLGISIPFLLASMTLASSPKYLKVLTKRIRKITGFAGIIMVILGILLVTDTYKYLNQYLFNLVY